LRFTHILHMTIAIVAIIAASAMAPSDTFAANGWQTTYFKAQHSGLCIDAQGNSNNARTRIQQWDCNHGGAQQWDLVYIAGGPKLYSRVGNYYSLRKHGTNMCIDIEGGSRNNGARAILWTCHKGLNQQFLLYDYFWTFNPKMSLINRNSAKCLDVPGFSRNRGTQIVQWDCNFGTNQQFLWNGK
jgi:endoglucanase